MQGEIVPMAAGLLPVLLQEPVSNSSIQRVADPPLRLLRDAYLEYQLNRGHAPRTVQKYDLVFRE
jgi:hypothetical protein